MKRPSFKIRRGMKLLMRRLLVVNMNLVGLVLLKMLSLMERHLIVVDKFSKLKKSILVVQHHLVIMWFPLTSAAVVATV
jgi:hypothetical protein